MLIRISVKTKNKMCCGSLLPQFPSCPVSLIPESASCTLWPLLFSCAFDIAHKPVTSLLRLLVIKDWLLFFPAIARLTTKSNSQATFFLTKLAFQTGQRVTSQMRKYSDDFPISLLPLSSLSPTPANPFEKSKHCFFFSALWSSFHIYCFAHASFT